MAAESKPVPGKAERELFLAALEKSEPQERAAFLDEACANDRALRGRVDELLREHDTVGSFLETPALGRTPLMASGGAALVATVTEKPGDRIGRYKLLEKIGEGGCGIVYMAEQEEPVRRRVALKVIKLGMDTRGVIARFEAERQALAMMDHPNIARVLDAAATETGRPYFVMELVRGVKITDYCDQNHLRTEQRLKLFIQVCLAIQHAHQKGVIHRDIKPSNILVTLHDGVPVPKVIDFGIAKATEQRLTDKTLFTAFTAFIGTPAYMSPEQAEMSGLDIDTRSDIYSLGVLLYELLIGRTPFDAEALLKAGLDGCRRTIRETEPARPSMRLETMVAAELTTTAHQRRTAAPHLIHQLRGDLDWIVMKCLEKDRTRRYATANDLAADIQNYLEGEPVIARPPSNVYRLQKLIHRHRRAFAGALALAVSLVAGVTISTWQAVRATRAERLAHAAQQEEARLRREAEREGAAARLNEYVADINLAKQSLEAGNYGRAVQLLNKHRPAEGAADVRGFEWRYLRRLSRGDEHVTLPRQEGAVQSVAVSPAGDLVVVGLREGFNRDKFSVWRLPTLTLVTNVPKGVGSLAFFPDGKRLATASPFTVRVWNTADWTEERALTNRSGPLALSATGARLATMSRDGVRVWDTAAWQEVCHLEGTFGPVALSPDGRALAAETRAGVTLWPLDGGGAELALPDSTNLFARAWPFAVNQRALAFSPDGRFLVAARNTLSERGVFILSIWNTQTGEESTMPDDPEHIEHTGAITSLAFSPDGRTLATASMDFSIRLWDFEKRQRIRTLQGHMNEVWCLAFASDGRTLVSGAADGEVKLWPIQEPPAADELPEVRVPLAFSPDGQTLAGLTRDGAVVFINLATMETEQQFQPEPAEPPDRGRFRFPRPGGPGPPAQPPPADPSGRGTEPPDRGRFRFPRPPPAVAFSTDLRTLAYSRDDGTVRFWNRDTGETNALKVADRPLDFVALSPDGQQLIARGRDWALRRWDLRTGASNVWRADAFKVLFSPDGRTLVTQGRGNDLQLWDAATLTLRTNLVVEETPAFALAFSADSRLLAASCQDDAVRVWDTATARILGTFTGHKQGVQSIAFSPDGRTLASASDDSTLKFWNVATQQELLTIRRLGGALRSLLFSPDGQLLVGGTSSTRPTGGLRFYRAPSPDETAAVTPPPRRRAERR